ncbi:chain length determinant protein EpsF [Povalibacter uvarum]|uniref:Chain length determinant protein EpsF n=1 Tax=Povalibacter uvarum TaxID=732238 RepID=A0A841HS34_9GAMM|nr:chain length determinant protein EpsF [Povalibacter uvarum]MBB6094695.1 chain length determinant protein EpsF [Povalibacter uvarum]
MSFTQLLRILWARRQLVIITTATVVGLAIMAFIAMPKGYVGTTSMVIDARAADPLTGASPNLPSTAAVIATQIDVIASRAVALKVTDMLKLPTDDARAEETGLEKRTREGWATELLKRLVVKPVADSNVVRIKFEDEDPQRAADVANAFAEAYMQASLDLRLDPAKRQSVWFEEQLTRLRGVVEDRREKLSQYQRSHGIVATTDRLDVENARLEEISKQLLEAQRKSQEANARMRQSQYATEGDRLQEVPEIMSNGLLQSLKADLVRAESKLAELSERYGRNHPQFIAANAEVQELRQKVNAEVGKAKGSIEQSSQIAQRTTADLQRAFDQQKQHILELNRQRDELSVQDREVQNAQAAYDAALQRASQLRLESQLTQTSVAVLDSAIAPSTPAGLGLFLSVALSLVFGGLLGAALALMLEMFDRRIRDGDELVSVAGIEVLGEVPRLRASFKPHKLPLVRGSRALLEGGSA